MGFENRVLLVGWVGERKMFIGIESWGIGLQGR